MELTAEQRAKIEENRRNALKKLEESKRKREEEEKLQQELAELHKAATEKAAATANLLSKLTCTSINEEIGEECGNTPINEALFTHFQIQICKSCKRSSDLFDCLPKSECIAQYLVPEDLFKTLPFMTKDNPHNVGWTPMKLYLRNHVQAAAIKRFGSVEKLHEEKKRRETIKLEKELLQTKDVLLNASAAYREELKGKDCEYNLTNLITTKPIEPTVVSNNSMEQLLGLNKKRKGGQLKATNSVTSKRKKFVDDLASCFHQK